MSKTQNNDKGIVKQGIKIAVGRTALAVDKVVDVVRDAAGRTEDAIDKARENVVEAMDNTEKRASDTLNKVEDELMGTTDTRPYEERTVEDLHALAATRDIKGRSTLRKVELIEALRA
jgi:hypothetical protein